MERAMSAGYILVKVANTAGGQATRAADAALALPGVERVELVSGPFDLILHVQAADRSAGLDLLTQVRAVSSVIRALPCWVSGEAARTLGRKGV
jgi:DNA-binding Lrp family transcriptional regulator